MVSITKGQKLHTNWHYRESIRYSKVFLASLSNYVIFINVLILKPTIREQRLTNSFLYGILRRRKE